MNEFEKLINKDKYQVFLFACPTWVPFNFARHPWFVLNKKGEISRYEVGYLENKNNPQNKHFYKDFLPPFQGIGILPYTLDGRRYKKIKLMGYLEGDEDCIAYKVIEFIENSKNNYPYCNKYSLFGPNSNTYAQWILNKFPEFNVKLSWRFVGKDYNFK